MNMCILQIDRCKMISKLDMKLNTSLCISFILVNDYVILRASSLQNEYTTVLLYFKTSRIHQT